METPEDIHVLRVPIPNNPLGFTLVYVIAGPEGHTMIDTGWDSEDSFDSLVAQLDRLGLDVKDVRQVFLTHMHPDHAGLAGRVRKVSGAKIYSHRSEAPMATADGSFGLPPFASYGVPREVYENSRFGAGRPPGHRFAEPDEWLVGGEVFRAGNKELEVIWTPGHAAGHICLYDRKNRVLFSGDHVLPVITSNISLLWGIVPDRDPLGDYLSSLAKLKPLEVETVFPAHEYVFSDLQGRLEELDRHHEERLQEMQAATGGEWTTAFDVARKITWTVGAFDMLEDSVKVMAVGETLAHLEFLHRRGELARKKESGVLFYGVAGA